MRPGKIKRLIAVVEKEFIHLRRDPRSLVIIFIMPLVMIFIFGNVLSFDLKKIETLIIDLDQSSLSRELGSHFAASSFYKVFSFETPTISPTGKVDYLAKAEEWLRQGKIKQYLYIPADFAQRFGRRLEPRVLVVIDGSDANVANRVYQYNQRLFAQFFSRALPAGASSLPARIEIKMYFNPEIISIPFIIPGLVAALMLMISALLTSLSLAREKETGSVELLFISPLRSSEIIVGKTIPYLLVSLLVGLAIFVFARVFFGLEFRGSYFLLFIIALIYILSGLALGILISTVASSQKVAMIATLLGTILPSMFLTGFIFPLESLAPLLRAISYIVPATYFLRILRGVALKGASLEHFLFEAGMLLAMSLVLLALASKKFQAMRQAKR